jgi:hypothetical protein
MLHNHPPFKKTKQQENPSAARPCFDTLSIRRFPPSPHEDFGFVGLKCSLSILIEKFLEIAPLLFFVKFYSEKPFLSN